MSDQSQGTNSRAGTPPTGPQSTPRRRSRLSWLLGICVLIAIVAAGFYWYQRAGSGAAAPAASAAMPPPQVTVAVPLRREITAWDESTGQCSAVDFVEMRPLVSCYIDSVHFKDGQLVQKGDLLYIIDPRPFEIALKSAQAQLDQSKAQLDVANRQLDRAGKLRKSDFVA